MARALGEAPHAITFRPDIPPALDAIVARMLARERERRYQTPGEVETALKPFGGLTV